MVTAGDPNAILGEAQPRPERNSLGFLVKGWGCDPTPSPSDRGWLVGDRRAGQALSSLTIQPEVAGKAGWRVSGKPFRVASFWGGGGSEARRCLTLAQRWGLRTAC